MRISDWSSDVCSSDLLRPAPQKMANAQNLRSFVEAHPAVRRQREIEPIHQARADAAMREEPAVLKNIADAARLGTKIGRALEKGARADTDMPAIELKSVV